MNIDMYKKYVYEYILKNINICMHKYIYGGARGVMVIVAGYGHGDRSSNPRPDWLHSTNTLGKGMNPNILPPAVGK